jgi:hypothetical protein
MTVGTIYARRNDFIVSRDPTRYTPVELPPGGLKPKVLTPDQVARIDAQRVAAEEFVKQSDARRAAASATGPQESNAVYYPNIEGLSLDQAVKVKGITEVSIEQNMAQDMDVFASYGEKTTKYPKEYLGWLDEYIAKLSVSASSNQAGSASNATVRASVSGYPDQSGAEASFAFLGKDAAVWAAKAAIDRSI